MASNILKQSANRRRMAIISLALVFLIAGVVSLTVSRATSYVLQAEAESGTKAGSAAVGPVDGASGAASVRFGSAAGCALPKYPDASCTGVPTGVQLTPYTPAGNVTIDTPNTIIDAKEISGCLTIAAPGVVIKRSKITCSAANRAVLSLYDTQSQDGTRRVSDVTLEDVEANCSQPQPVAGLEGHNLTLRRLLIQGCARTIVSQGNLLLEDSHIRQLRNPAPIGTSTNPTASGVTFTLNQAATGLIRHTTIDATGGGWGISLGLLNQQAQVAVQNNYIKGGTWGVSCPANSSINPRGTIRLIDNRFTSTTAKSDIMLQCADEVEVRGNAYFENGNPIP